jgi:predicted dehydrogenase
MVKVNTAVFGHGARGRKYASHPDINVVAVCDPSHINTALATKDHGDVDIYADYAEFLAQGKLAGVDLVIVASPDRTHASIAIAVLQTGYNLLLEKPMGVTLDECLAVAAAARAARVYFRVCHIMNDMPANLLIAKLVAAGEIGKVVSVDHTEGVGNLHFVRSFVRGNWNDPETSSPVIVAKGSHDFGLLIKWLGTADVTKVWATGKQKIFTAENKPAAALGATECTKCPLYETCMHSSREYIEAYPIAGSLLGTGPVKHPLKCMISEGNSLQDLEDVLATTPYGKCVYGDAGGKQPEDITVMMEFENGVTTTHRQTAFSSGVCVRKTVITGTLGVLRCENDLKITVEKFPGAVKISRVRGVDLYEPSGGVDEYDFTEEIAAALSHGMGGHGGADYLFTTQVVRDVTTFDPADTEKNVAEALAPFVLAYHAEAARVTGEVVTIPPQVDHSGVYEEPSLPSVIWTVKLVGGIEYEAVSDGRLVVWDCEARLPPLHIPPSHIPMTFQADTDSFESVEEKVSFDFDGSEMRYKAFVLPLAWRV